MVQITCGARNTFFLNVHWQLCFQLFKYEILNVRFKMSRINKSVHEFQILICEPYTVKPFYLVFEQECGGCRWATALGALIVERDEEGTKGFETIMTLDIKAD